MAVYGAETCFALAANACLGMSQGLGTGHEIIPIVREELAACRGNTLIMVVEDDRVYPRDALETWLHYNQQLRRAALCFRSAAMPRTLDWRHARMIKASELRQPEAVAVITECGSYLI